MPSPALPPASVSIVCAAAAVGAAAQTEKNLPPLDAGRVRAIAAMLPAAPAGPGRPISDRAYWEKLAASDPAWAGLVGRAEKLLATPLPPYPRDLYLEFTKNGNRTHYQSAEGARRNRLPVLVFAECVENKGRFLPAIAELIDSLNAEPTWVLPAHDSKLTNFEGKSVDIELASSALAADYGVTDWLLGEKLPAATRAALRENVQRRILTPFRDMVDGRRAPNWWILGTNNWNAVCLAGVATASLCIEPKAEDRAVTVAASERYVQNFLSGFTPDGYCGEGLGYWNYGFGRFYLLSEAVRQATGEKLDLLADPGAKAPALFAARIGIMNGISPAFADCGVTAKPDAALMHALDRRFALGIPEYAGAQPVGFGDVFTTMLYVSSQDAPPVAGAARPAALRATASGGLPIRDFFDRAGILIVRPGPGGTAKLGAALKGGNNAESHNHNDLGSYVVVVGDRPVILDPGGETYTARTFSSRRYESKLLNSFGHPVPVIGGTLQHDGADAVAKVVETAFTPEKDRFTLDIKSAYKVPDLKSLTRTWEYSRTGDGSLTVTDRVSLSRPLTFGTAFLTAGGWQKQADGSLFVYDGDNALIVKIDTGGAPYTLHPEVINEDAAVHPTRIGIDLDSPVRQATVTLTITPAPETGPAAGGNLLKNGGFERGGYGWSLGRDGGISAVATGQAAAGSASLRIHDDSDTVGASVTTARLSVPDGAKTLTLTGKADFASGSGVGVYVRFYDASGALIGAREAGGNEKPVGTLPVSGATMGHWSPFSFGARVPAGAAKFEVWLHSFNGGKCDAYLDDLAVTAN